MHSAVEYFCNVIFTVESFRKANPAMGASHSRDIERTTTAEGENVRIKYAAASMQGFGGKVEDAVSNLLVILTYCWEYFKKVQLIFQ